MTEVALECSSEDPTLLLLHWHTSILLPPAECASSCPRTSNNVSSYDPVCVITRTTLGTRETTTTSYFNPCIAQCYVSGWPEYGVESAIVKCGMGCGAWGVDTSGGHRDMCE